MYQSSVPDKLSLPEEENFELEVSNLGETDFFLFKLRKVKAKMDKEIDKLDVKEADNVTE